VDGVLVEPHHEVAVFGAVDTGRHLLSWLRRSIYTFSLFSSGLR
jgi:hypothetical protein